MCQKDAFNPSLGPQIGIHTKQELKEAKMRTNCHLECEAQEEVFDECTFIMYLGEKKYGIVESCSYASLLSLSYAIHDISRF